MAIKRRKRLHAEVATSALSDIMFFLLLFFLIISTLANPNVIKVPLPESKANEKTNKQHVTLTVTQDKKYFIDKKEVAFNEIEAKLLAETAKIKDKTVILRIPFDSQVQELVDLLRIGMDNGLKVIIATKGDS
jgi:biopolymer transport protein ExbD